MQSELRKMLQDELSMRDRVNSKIRSMYARGARARYSTFSYTVDVEVIETSHEGRVKIRNLATMKTRWIEGRSRDLVWISSPVSAPAPEAAVQG